MDLGQKLLDLRKSKNLSQEEAAEKLDVTRQTISKWETNQSTPDFDKISSICELYGISPNELITGKKEEVSKIPLSDEEIKKGKASGIGIAVLLYILSFAWMVFSVAGINMNPVIAASIFLVIVGVATFLIIYTCMIYKKEKTVEEKKKDKLRHQIEDVIAVFTLFIYLFISFKTGAWHLTWLIWIIFGLISEVLSLIFMLGGNKNEK